MDGRPSAHPLFDLGPSRYVKSASGSSSGLTDRERSLLGWLAIQNICRQFGCTPEAAVEALEHFSDETTIEGDQFDVYLKVRGHVHIHAERDWLRAMAHGHGTDPVAN